MKTKTILMLFIVGVFSLACVGCGTQQETTVKSSDRYETMSVTQPANYKPEGTEELENNPLSEHADQKFTNALANITEQLAKARGMAAAPSSYGDKFVFVMPSEIKPDSTDLTVRYLSGKLIESIELGYDFSSLLGQEVLCQVNVFVGTGISCVYVGISDPTGNIAGLWTDDLQAPTDDKTALLHWTLPVPKA